MPQRLSVAAAAAAAVSAALTLHGCGGGGGGGGPDDPCATPDASDDRAEFLTLVADALVLPRLTLHGVMSVDVVVDSTVKNITAAVVAKANAIDGVTMEGNSVAVVLKQLSPCAHDSKDDDKGTHVKLTVPGEIERLTVHKASVVVPWVLRDVMLYEGANVDLKEWGGHQQGPEVLQGYLDGGSSMTVHQGLLKGDELALNLFNSSQLRMLQNAGAIDRIEVTTWQSTVSLEAESTRLELNGHNSTVSFAKCTDAYLKMDKDMIVTIFEADGKVVECSEGQKISIAGTATIIPPEEAKKDPFCATPSSVIV